MSHRLLLILGLAAALLVTVLVLEVRRRAPEVQIPACFERMGQGMRDRDASTVLSAVHLDYDFHAHWPDLFPDPKTGRSNASQLLARVFLMAREENPDLTSTISGMKELPDGTWEATVTITITGRPFVGAVPNLVAHRFRLARGSPITGRWRIIDHDPFAIRAGGGW